MAFRLVTDTKRFGAASLLTTSGKKTKNRLVQFAQTI